MAEVDIPVPDKLRDVLSAPKCIDLSLPEPKKLTITLPSGASLSSLSNAGQNIPNDCSLTFSLMLQIAPIMASMECVLKILKLIKPLSDIISGLPAPPSPKLLKDFAEAVADLAPCFLMLTPAGMIPFVRDILCLILKLLNCLIGQLKTALDFLSGLSIKLESAEDPELLETLECAQQNVLTSIGHLMKGFEPIQTLMELAGPFMSIAGVEAIQLPALGSADDIESVTEVVSTLEDVKNTIQQIVDALGGCPE